MKVDRNRTQGQLYQVPDTSATSNFRDFGAGDGIQTRGLYLGRVPLYQLSYARICACGLKTAQWLPWRP